MVPGRTIGTKRRGDGEERTSVEGASSSVRTFSPSTIHVQRADPLNCPAPVLEVFARNATFSPLSSCRSRVYEPLQHLQTVLRGVTRDVWIRRSIATGEERRKNRGNPRSQRILPFVSRPAHSDVSDFLCGASRRPLYLIVT